VTLARDDDALHRLRRGRRAGLEVTVPSVDSATVPGST
jgi:hypothetical protein